MRAKKLLKTTGIVLLSILGVGFLAITAFVWNPFEGVYPDLRDAIPRNVDFYLRKQDLRDDFSSFPEPHFFADYRATAAYDRLLASKTWNEANRAHGIEKSIAELRAAFQQADAQGLDLLAEVVGEDLIAAGMFDGKPANPSWLAVMRVSWKLRIALGALRNSWLRGFASGLDLQVDAEGNFAINLQGTTVHAALLKDLLIVAKTPELLQRSLRLATGESEEDSFGRIADYQDEIVASVDRWREVTGRESRATEFHLDLQSYLRGVTWDDNWPNPNSPTSDLERILALFLDLRTHQKLMGTLLFMGPDSLAFTVKSFMNRSNHAPFQQRLFGESPQTMSEWATPFLLDTVPSTACATLLLRVQVESLLEELFLAMEKPYRDEVNQQVAVAQSPTGKPFNGVHDLLRYIGTALFPQFGLMLRNNEWDTDVYKGLEVSVKPSPVPCFACVFWVRPGEDARVQEFLKWLDRNHHLFGFKKAFDYSAGPGNLWQVREWSHPLIEGTGSMAALFMEGRPPNYLLLSNSGPFLREIVDLRYSQRNTRSILDEASFRLSLGGRTASGSREEPPREVPSATNGLLLLHGANLRALVNRYRRFAAVRFDERVRDPGWEMEERPRAEQAIMARKFPNLRSRNSLTTQEAQELDRLVDQEMQQRWLQVLPAYQNQGQNELEAIGLLLDALKSAYLHLRLEPHALTIHGRLEAAFP